MSKNTKNYGLFEYEPEKDGAQTFNIQSALNENWEKIDEALAASDPTKAGTKETPADADGVLLADSADDGKAAVVDGGQDCAGEDFRAARAEN